MYEIQNCSNHGQGYDETRGLKFYMGIYLLKNNRALTNHIVSAGGIECGHN